MNDEKYGEPARELMDDAKEMLSEIIDQDLLTASAKYGFWKANSHGDDIVIKNNTDEEICRLNMLRQQQDRGSRIMPVLLTLWHQWIPEEGLYRNLRGYCWGNRNGKYISRIWRRLPSNYDQYSR